MWMARRQQQLPEIMDQYKHCSDFTSDGHLVQFKPGLSPAVALFCSILKTFRDEIPQPLGQFLWELRLLCSAECVPDTQREPPKLLSVAGAPCYTSWLYRERFGSTSLVEVLISFPWMCLNLSSRPTGFRLLVVMFQPCLIAPQTFLCFCTWGSLGLLTGFASEGTLCSPRCLFYFVLSSYI